MRNNIKGNHITATFLILFCCAGAQTKHTYNSSWLRLYLNGIINDKMRWDIMIQNRRVADNNSYNIFEREQLQSYCLWLQYGFKKDLKFSFSPVCYFTTKPISKLNSRFINEWNWNVRIDYRKAIKKSTLQNRLALEYRYRDLIEKNIFVGNFRTRYLLRLITPLFNKNDKAFNLVLNDEIFFQFGEAVKNASSPFDQNRIYGGFNYPICKDVKFDLGYCYVYQLRLSGKDADVQNAIWFALTFDNLFSNRTKKEVEQPAK